MNVEKRKLAAEIAPAVRVMYADRACVRYIEDVGRAPSDAGLKCLEIENKDAEGIFASLEKNRGGAYDVIQVDGLGSFCIGACKQDADNVCSVLGGGAQRQAAAPRGGRLANKIALITGAASGFGEGMSLYMAEEGAYIAVADINYEEAVKKARVINDKHGAGTAFPIYVDIADEQKTEDMFAECVLEYGGLDIFIACAGVSHGGGLDTMDLEMFEFMTKMNYTSFYIGTKYASRIMKIENRFDSEYTSDIIQINSKSGLDGSINNFTYAGAKFGGIGLVQSFAKELVGNGIKVNAICPGNYYDGPMWSDPVKGLFVQYLEVGKVQGAKTVEDVRKYHVDKTPMRRGCTPLDVVRAVYYCVEQQYETGQAIPVSGGQIMLK